MVSISMMADISILSLLVRKKLSDWENMMDRLTFMPIHKTDFG